MTRKTSSALLITLLICGAASSAAAQNANAAHARILAYRQLGAAFKTLNETLRRGDAASPEIRKSAQQIVDMSKRQYALFPSDSRNAPGVRIKARAEIWTKPADFRSAQDNFAQQAALFMGLTSSGDAGAMRAGVRKLGGACKSCHDRFREDSE